MKRVTEVFLLLSLQPRDVKFFWHESPAELARRSQETDSFLLPPYFFAARRLRRRSISRFDAQPKHLHASSQTRREE